MLSPRFACRRFGVRSRDPCLWSLKKCGVISCTRVNVATKTSWFGDVANEGGQHQACSRARGMPVNRGLMQRIWAARWTIPTLGFRQTKVLCSVQVSDNLRELFKRHREREAPGEAAAQGPEVWVTVPSGVPIQTPGVQDNKRNSLVRGQANSRQFKEMVRSLSSQRRPRPSPGPGKSAIHGVLRTLFRESQEPGRDRWLDEPYQCHQGGRVARRWRWRKVLHEAGARRVERPQRRDRTSDGESGPQRKRSRTLPRGPIK